MGWFGDSVVPVTLDIPNISEFYTLMMKPDRQWRLITQCVLVSFFVLAAVYEYEQFQVSGCSSASTLPTYPPTHPPTNLPTYLPIIPYSCLFLFRGVFLNLIDKYEGCDTHQNIVAVCVVINIFNT